MYNIILPPNPTEHLHRKSAPELVHTPPDQQGFVKHISSPLFNAYSHRSPLKFF